MGLSRVEHQGGSATPLLIAHGLYGSARNWGAIAKRLAPGRPVTAVDMRNHAGSPWHPTHSYADLAADLAAEMVDGTDLLGHSMGGFGTWNAIWHAPERFAAAIPSAGGLPPWRDPARFKDVPVWGTVHGGRIFEAAAI